MSPLPPNTAFTGEQQNYLAGFFAGLRSRESMPFLGKNRNGQFTADPARALQPDEAVFGTPLDELSREELIKYEQNGLDCWSTIERNAAARASLSEALK